MMITNDCVPYPYHKRISLAHIFHRYPNQTFGFLFYPKRQRLRITRLYIQSKAKFPILSHKFFWKIFIYYHTSVLIITKSRLRSSISLDVENFSFKPKNRIVINFELVCDVVWVAVFCSKLSENDGRLYLTYSLLVYCTFARFAPFFVNN